MALRLPLILVFLIVLHTLLLMGVALAKRSNYTATITNPVNAFQNLLPLFVYGL